MVIVCTSCKKNLSEPIMELTYLLISAAVLAMGIFFASRIRVGKFPPVPSSKRSLGLLESWYVAHRPRPRIFVQSLQFTGAAPITADELRPYLVALAQKHLALQMHIDESAKCYQVLENWPKYIYVAESSRPVSEVTGSEVNLDSSSFPGLLWRVTIVTERKDAFYIVLTLEHCLGDGISATVILQDLTELLNLQSEELSHQTFTPAPYVALDHVFDVRPTVGVIVSALIEDARRAPKVVFGYRGPEQLPNSVKRTTREHYYHVFEREELKRLIQRCKAEGTTVHAAICIAASMAVYETVGTKASKQLVDTVINLRPHINHPSVSSRSLGDLVTSTNIEVDFEKPARFWDRAREHKQTLTNKIPTAHAKLGLIKFISKPLSEWLAANALKHPNARQATLEVSNVGTVNLPKQAGKWQVGDMLFAQHNHNISALYGFSVVTSGASERLAVSLSVVEQLVSEKEVKEIMSTFAKLLNAAATSS